MQVKALVRALSTRDNWRNWLFLAVDWSVIVGAVWLHLLVADPFVYLLVAVLIGSRMRALANLMHEAGHSKLFRNRRVNNVVGAVLCSWPIFIPFRRFVVEHGLHHRHLWRSAQDPDLDLYASTRTEHASRERISFARFVVEHVLLVLIPVMPLWRLYRTLIGDRMRLLVVAALTAVAVAVLSATGSVVAHVVVFCWIVPWLTTFQCISYWAELGEHGGLRAFGWSWGSRNWRGNPVSRWLIGSHSDDIYHLLHHWFPSVPHHKLKALDVTCKSVWRPYGSHVRCGGFFFGNRHENSVLRDIWTGGHRL
ncbi:Fatty acid desaturase [Actinokineospora diospyrosa]|uniref:Fatty acid desaturase n=1 Tax=Actinokineospora diospyrosa TaxID=103728 RepID=A0ABT1IBT5_9PSEU|nr:Fatty acid desaturase [Actinokineospora diospyrosa]